MISSTKVSGKDYILRFIDFCNADLDSSSISEKLMWSGTFFILVSGGHECQDQNHLIRLCDEKWDEIETFQENLMTDLNKFYALTHDDIQIRVFEPETLDWTDGKFRFGQQLHSSTLPIPEDVAFHVLDIEILEVHADENYVNLEKDSLNRSFLELMRALDGYPRNSMKRCVHCKKIFFNHSKREKKYCSSRCQNTAAVKRLRQRQK